MKTLSEFLAKHLLNREDFNDLEWGRNATMENTRNP